MLLLLCCEATYIFYVQGDVIPTAERWKAVDQLMLCDRATEEMQRVKDDIASSLVYFSRLHDAMTSAATDARVTTRALILRKLHELHTVMKSVWQVANKHLENVPLLPGVDFDFNDTLAVPLFQDISADRFDDDASDASDCESDDEQCN